MNFKNILETLSQLSEGVKEKEGGRVHTADPGGYGRKYDTDEEGDEKKKKDAEPAAKRGRGRPKKGADDSGDVKKYDNAKNLQDYMIGNKPKKSKELDKLPAKKHTLKDWFDRIDEKYIAEAEQLTLEPAKQSTQVLKKGNEVVGTVTNPALAATIKSAIGKGEMSLAGEKLGEEEGDYSAKKARAGKDIGKPGKQFAKIAKDAAKRYGSKERGEKVAGAVLAKLRSKTNEAERPSDDSDMGAGLGAGRSMTTFEGQISELSDKKLANYQAKAQKQLDKGENVAKRTAGVLRTSHSARRNKGLDPHADTSNLQNYPLGEGAKPDFLDLDKDGNKKESMKKAAQDKKKKVKEGMNHRLQAARLEGKAHGLKGHAYHGKAFEDMEEARAYHEGFKEGLDECYGMKPIQGMVDEMGAPPATVPGMANQAEEMAAMEAEMEEGNLFTGNLAKARAAGKTMADLDNDGDMEKVTEFAFEDLDRELQKLLTESEGKIEEGMSVSISKGQQGMPDSVSVTAQDAEAEQLLGLIKTLGGGLFGGEEQRSDYGAPAGSDSHGGINVVGDHDGMMGIMKKLSGIEQSGSGDYADEEGDDGCGCDDEETTEAACNECGMSEGMHESGCSMGKGKEMVDEVETEDQMEFEVAEDNAPDSEEAEHTADEEAEAQTDMALAKSDQQNKTTTFNEGGDGGEASEETDQYTDADAGEEMDASEEEEELNEWANNAGDKGTDAAFERDIEFMTKVISGGLNKPKSTGQATTPIIASQLNRQHSHQTTDINESITDWKKLAGIK